MLTLATPAAVITSKSGCDARVEGDPVHAARPKSSPKASPTDRRRLCAGRRLILPLLLAVLAFGALLPIVAPLLRGNRPVASRGSFDQAVYRDQLQELDQRPREE
jgi:hypothetical protein